MLNTATFLSRPTSSSPKKSMLATHTSPHGLLQEDLVYTVLQHSCTADCSHTRGPPTAR